jgi:bifunctional enzyme CysN/CysC/sulfate adenylyltransferase subunit 1
MGTENPLKFVMVGHIDHGKSTLIGRLFYDTNSLPPDKVAELKKASEQRIDGEMEFAFIMDHLREEREQGITIDTAHTFFHTEKREYVIIDAPGHVEFVKNMLTGASQAEAALLIVDANEGVGEQTKRHANLVSMLGVEQIIVVINKMDVVDYEENHFNNLKEEVQEFLGSINLKPDYYIPISALKGDNVAKRSENMEWYQGQTVLESLDSLKNEVPPEDKGLIFPVQDVYKISGKRIAVGRIEAGTLQSGMEVKILPGGGKTTIKSLEKFNEKKNKAVAGESIGITTTDPVFLERGNVLCVEEKYLTISDKVNSSLIWLSKEAFSKDEKLGLRLATQETRANIAEIRERVDSSSLEILEEKASSINNLEIGEVEIETKKPLAFTKFGDVKEMGRFVLVRGNDVVAGGIIL